MTRFVEWTGVQNGHGSCWHLVWLDNVVTLLLSFGDVSCPRIWVLDCGGSEEYRETELGCGWRLDLM